MDTSWNTQIHPFLFQEAGEDYEINVLWRLFAHRRQGESTRTMVAPLWWSERPRDDVPSEVQVLGGFFARDCNYERGLQRYRLLWLFEVWAGSFEVDTLSMFGLHPVLAAPAD